VEDRPIQAGDFAVIDLVGVQIGAHGEDLKQIIEQENLQVAVGDERTHPAFSEALIDLNIAEGKQVEISYQRDYPDQILAGKRVRFSFEVTDIKTRAIPQLSDEFARDVGDYGGLDDLKQEIRRQLGEQVLRRKDEGARRQALQKLIELTPIEAPDVLVAQEIDRRIQDYAVHLQSQGIDPLRSSVNWSELRQSLHAGAVKDVQGKLLLSKIAEVEGLAVSDEELEEEKARMATVMNLPPEKIAQRFSDSARQQSLREHLMRQKSLRLVLDSARIDFVEPADSTVE
jgi:trigger factor